MSEIPWTWLIIRGSGLTAWALLTCVVIWGLLLRTRILADYTSPARLLDLHRWLGAAALGFLAIHMIALLIDPVVRFTAWQILIPGLATWNTLAVSLGVIAFWTLIPVGVIGRIRSRLGKAGNRWFKRTHLLAYTAWPLATGHYILAGTDTLTTWSIAALITSGALLTALLIARGWYSGKQTRRTQGGTNTTRQRSKVA